VEAAEATLVAFVGKPLTWGKWDCARLVAFDLKRLGHKPRLSRGGYYKSPIGARRALKRAGFETLEAALDDLALPRIGFASALPGDVVALESGEDWPGLAIALGNGRILAFSAAHGVCGVGQPTQDDIRGVWRADPCRTSS
jgi:hypothetical protein